jgi:anti-sigma B factor antagonist
MPRQAGPRVATPSLVIVRDTEGTTAVVRARGELDLATAGLLVRAIGTAAADIPRPRVLVDLAEVEFCDSAGLRALLGAAREIEARAGRMVVAVVPGSVVDRLLELVGLREFLRVLPPDDARRAL